MRLRGRLRTVGRLVAKNARAVPCAKYGIRNSGHGWLGLDKLQRASPLNSPGSAFFDLPFHPNPTSQEIYRPSLRNGIHGGFTASFVDQELCQPPCCSYIGLWRQRQRTTSLKVLSPAMIACLTSNMAAESCFCHLIHNAHTTQYTLISQWISTLSLFLLPGLLQDNSVSRQANYESSESFGGSKVI